MDKLIKQLIQARIDAGLTPADMAKGLGCADSTVMRLERGGIEWKLKTAIHYCDICNTSIDKVYLASK